MDLGSNESLARILTNFLRIPLRDSFTRGTDPFCHGSIDQREAELANLGGDPIRGVEIAGRAFSGRSGVLCHSLPWTSGHGVG